jgi:UDP-2,3-diacylglucosamine pyrophosphatase LpxH
MRSLPPWIVKCNSLADRYRLWAIGDVHLYNRACIVSELDALIDEIRGDPHSLWIGLGDMADCISPYDPRFDAQEVAPEKRSNFFQKLGRSIIKDLTEKFAPIKGQCVGLLRGNHESKYESHTDQAIMEDVCENLGVRYCDYCCAFDLVFAAKKASESFKLWAHHGAGGATTTGGKINKLKKAMTEVFDADIYLMGHCHEQLDLSLVHLYQDERGVIRQRKKQGVVTGAYLATYHSGTSGYGEQKLYSPVSLGSVAVTIVPGTRRLGVEKR